MRMTCVNCGAKLFSRAMDGKFNKTKDWGQIMLGCLKNEAELGPGSIPTGNTITRRTKVKIPLCKKCIKSASDQDITDAWDNVFTHDANVPDGYTLSEIYRS
jgi:hypothetical protein